MKLPLVMLLISFGTSAAEPQSNAINKLNRDVASAEYEIQMLSLVRDSAERQKHIGKLDATKEQIDADLKPALNFAKKHADLAKAVKEYYLAAQNFFDAAFATNSFEKATAERAKSQLDAADNAMHLEEQLAGLR